MIDSVRREQMMMNEIKQLKSDVKDHAKQIEALELRLIVSSSPYKFKNELR